jgi:hypothetical protein
VVVETRWGEPLPLAELLDELLQVVAPELLDELLQVVAPELLDELLQVVAPELQSVPESEDPRPRRGMLGLCQLKSLELFAVHWPKILRPEPIGPWWDADLFVLSPNPSCQPQTSQTTKGLLPRASPRPNEVDF